MSRDETELDAWLDALERDPAAAGRPSRDLGVATPTQRARLLEILAHHEVAAARDAALRALRREPPSSELAAALARCVATDPDAEVRRRAVATAAREHDAAQTRAAVVTALGDPDDDVARMAATSICECRDPSSLSADEVDAVCVYPGRGDTGQEGRIGRLLAARDDRRAVPMLLFAFEHGSHFWHDAGRRPLERAESFAALARLAPDDAATRSRIETALVDAVRRDPYSWGKEAAWRGLARLGWSTGALGALYREVAPSTHPPSSARARASFDAGAERERLATTWSARLTDPDARLRADARAIVRWIKCPHLAKEVRAAAALLPGDERRALQSLADDLDALA